MFLRIGAACSLLLMAACSSLPKRAAAGDADAQFRYGRKLLRTDKTAHAKDAFLYFLTAAEQEHSTATAAVALCYEKGWGTPRNRHLARRWYAMAERLGHVESTLALAAMDLQDGDTASMTRRLDPLCEWHFLPAELYLALLYMSNKSPHFNPEKGVRYLRYAALDGSKEAAEMMATCYEQGIGVPRCETLARGWRSIAEGGVSLSL